MVRANCRWKVSHVLCPRPWREEEVGQSGREYDIWVPPTKLPSDVRKIYCDELITPSVAGGRASMARPLPRCVKCQWIQNGWETNLFGHQMIKPVRFLLMP